MKLETERLILRPWEDRDRAPLAAILGDPHVRRYYPSTATPEEVNAQIDHAIALTAEHGFHFWAAEHKADRKLIGLVGVASLSDRMRTVIDSDPGVEIGWQFDKDYWGQGLAPEGARAWLDHAWKTLGFAEVVAFTAQTNLPSQRVMEKIGMRRDPADDFAHPNLAEGHPLRQHVLYRIKRPG